MPCPAALRRKDKTLRQYMAKDNILVNARFCLATLAEGEEPTHSSIRNHLCIAALRRVVYRREERVLTDEIIAAGRAGKVFIAGLRSKERRTAAGILISKLNFGKKTSDDSALGLKKNDEAPYTMSMYTNPSLNMSLTSLEDCCFGMTSFQAVTKNAIVSKQIA